MIYTVTFNPSIDCFYRLPDFRTGNVNRAEEEYYYPGGKGLNVSMMLHECNISTTALGFLAGSTGHAIQKMLDETGCPTDFIFIKNGFSRINTKLHTGQETEINGIGPLPSSEDLNRLKEKLQQLKKGDTLVLSGSIPHKLSDDTYFTIMQALAPKEINTVVDTTGELLLHSLQARPFLIKPNLQELADLFHTSLHTREEIIKTAEKLQQMGARNVLVSMAGDGAILLTDDKKIYKQNVPKGTVVNSVGAGDAMIAGFLAGFLQSNDYIHGLRLAAATGSATAFSHHLANYHAVEKMLELLPETKTLSAF